MAKGKKKGKSKKKSSGGKKPVEPKKKLQDFVDDIKDDDEQLYLANILNGEPKETYKSIQSEFVKKKGDTIFLTQIIDNAEDFYNKAQKAMNKNQLKAVTNYIKTLNNIKYSRSFKAKFKDADGNVKDTYVGLEDVEGLGGITKPQPPIPPPPIPPKTGGKFLLDELLQNKPDGYQKFMTGIQKLTVPQLRAFSRYVRQNYNYRIVFSRKKKPEVINNVRKFIVDDLIKREKLDQIQAGVAEVEEPAKIKSQYQEILEAEKAGVPEGELLRPLKKYQDDILKERVEKQLEGEEFDIDEFIKNKLQIGREEQISKFLLQYDDRDKTVRYKKSSVLPRAYTKKSIRDTLDKILLNNVYIDRLNDAIDKNVKSKQFRERSKYDRADIINKSIEHDVTIDDLRKAIEDPEFRGLMDIIQNKVTGEVKPLTIPVYYRTVEELRKIKQADKARLADIAGDIFRYARTYEGKEDKLIKTINERVNSLPDVQVLPEGVKVKPVAPEEITTDLDKYNSIMKQIAELKKTKPSEVTDEIKDQIKLLENQAEKYKEGAKKEKAAKAQRDRRTATALKRSGNFRPHFKNPTQQAVSNAIGETAEEQIRDIKNWYIFDLPDYYTGVGNRLDNPLVKQNNSREWMLVDNTDLYTNTRPYLLTDGVDERKDFFNQHSQLNKQGVNIGLQNHKWEETEQEFLERFNSGSNGLFTQDQSKKEVSDFKPIYQTPARYIDGQGKKPQWTNNRGMTHNNKEWINNLNLFYKGADIQ